MSRVAGRLSMAPGDGEEGRKKRLDSLNGGNGSGTTGKGRRSLNVRRELPGAEGSDPNVHRRVTRSQTATARGVQERPSENSGAEPGGSNAPQKSQNNGRNGRSQTPQERPPALKKVPKKRTPKTKDNDAKCQSQKKEPEIQIVKEVAGQPIVKNEPPEVLSNVDDIITQISELSIRSDRSTAQIKRNINHSNECLELMNEEEWQKLCRVLIDSALVKEKIDLVVELFSPFLRNPRFCETMCKELYEVYCQKLLNIEGSNVPAFLAKIVCASYPPEYAKNINGPILEAVGLVRSWMDIVNEDTERFHKKEKKPVHNPIRVASEGADLIETHHIVKAEIESDEEETVNPNIIIQSAIALCLFCENSQHLLCYKHPTVCDELKSCFKRAVSYNSNLAGDIKMRLLSNYDLVINWIKMREVIFGPSQSRNSSAVASH